MNVALDIGNSSTKVGIFDNHQLSERFVLKTEDDLEKFLINFSGDYIIISSVNVQEKKVLSYASRFKRRIALMHTTPLPIKIAYKTPNTLGMDRVAAVCGAVDGFKNCNCLVIDAGTSITYDYVDKSGEYHGGGLSLGIGMRFRALHSFTARLPLVETRNSLPNLVGDSTVSCIESGVMHGVIDEVDGVIRRYQQKFGDLTVILTGGDSVFFENNLKASIFASPELVLRGLNSILLHNVS